MTSATEAYLVVGSGTLTFGGWGGNLECLERLHPSFAAEAFDDAADFLESLVIAKDLRLMPAGHVRRVRPRQDPAVYRMELELELGVR